MGILTEWITEWLKGLLIEGIMGNLEGLFDTVNTRVGEISVQVGTTPAAWNAGVFSLIRQLSETVILPIAGLILTFVATYELIQMILEKNNMHEFDVANIYKWVFKTTCAILILSNTFNIVMAVFDVSQSVIASAAGIVTGATNITPDMLADLEMTLETMELGSLLGLFLQSFLIKFTMLALNIFIFVIVYGRMIEIYLLTSLAPIPVATLSACVKIGHIIFLLFSNFTIQSNCNQLFLLKGASSGQLSNCFYDFLGEIIMTPEINLYSSIFIDTDLLYQFPKFFWAVLIQKLNTLGICF